MDPRLKTFLAVYSTTDQGPFHNDRRPIPHFFTGALYWKRRLALSMRKRTNFRILQRSPIKEFEWTNVHDGADLGFMWRNTRKAKSYIEAVGWHHLL